MENVASSAKPREPFDKINMVIDKTTQMNYAKVK